MDLNQITTQVRPRNKWQAIDLGFKMASVWYVELFKGYMVIALPIFIIVNLIFAQMPLAALFIFWWLKPVYERIQLGFLSRALFGNTLNLKQQIALWMQTPKSDWLGSILTRRISLRRSYYNPINQLELQRGKNLSKRKVAFEGQNSNAAFWLTFVLVHLESIIVIGLMTLANYLIPEQVGVSIDIWGFDETDQYTTIYNNLLMFISYTLIAPFYTCSGFSLYINQRTQIEGWDIEISFKRLIERTQSNQTAKFKSNLNKNTNGAKSLFMLMLVTCLTSFSEPTIAEQQDTEQRVANEQSKRAKTQEQQQAYDHIQQIIKSDTFNQKETRSYPEAFLNMNTDGEKNRTQTQFELPQWLHSLLNTLSFGIEWLLTLAVITILVIFLVRYRHWFAQFLPEHIEQPQGPKYNQLFGLQMPEQDLLDDLQQQAKKLCQTNKKREALSLLYRASLQVLVNQQHIKLCDALTEGECVHQVKQNANKTISHYFNNLTKNWQRLAYANQEPNQATLDKLIEQWSQVFNPTTDADEPNTNNQGNDRTQGGNL